MRKIGYGLALIVLIGLIAVMVRAQLGARHEATGLARAESPNIDANWNAPESSAVTPVGQNTAVTAVPPNPPARPNAAQPRPVFSDTIPTIVAPPETAQAQAGTEVLKRAASAYGAVKSLRADFSQTRENALLGSTTLSRGTIYQRSPDRFLLKFSSPPGDVIVGDGRYFWIYYPSVDRKQVLRAPASTSGAGGVDLRSQFLGDPVRRFKHTYHGTETGGGRTLHVLTLTPREQSGYRTLKVWIDGKDYLARRFIITEPSGAVADFRLSNLAVNPTLADALFRFTPPADARIVER